MPCFKFHLLSGIIIAMATREVQHSFIRFYPFFSVSDNLQMVHHYKFLNVPHIQSFKLKTLVQKLNRMHLVTKYHNGRAWLPRGNRKEKAPWAKLRISVLVYQALSHWESFCIKQTSLYHWRGNQFHMDKIQTVLKGSLSC